MNKSNTINPVILSIKFAELSQIQSVLQGVDKFHRIITLNSGQNYNQMYFTPGSASFESSISLDNPGELHENILVCKYPGDGSNVPSQIDSFQMKRGVIVYSYNDGTIRTFGTISNPIICFASFSTKDKCWIITFKHKDVKGTYII